MGELENWVRKNRSAFDSEEPSQEVWRAIQARNRQKVNWWLYGWKSAAVLLLLCTCYLLYERQLDSSTSSAQEGQQAWVHQPVEAYYTELISSKTAAVVGHGDQKLTREFLLEINRLEKQYKELQRAYHYQNEADRLENAMIQNLRLRLELLDRQLHILETQKEKRNEKAIHS
ncbi:hypothetical protein [Marinoscillum furvescens]|uniref:Uncharacterized protein n=1 Tax=Marinoscillum furvescens DSM 4134 TaxID=1122208 RepID=A0A3D9L229_MARFU|nr:hypothetical protein [Marinoscillum furvescens]RED97444.1 hypothetical protein C7460_11253 [Marinoscillum furvescens DSM 4134]